MTTDSSAKNNVSNVLAMPKRKEPIMIEIAGHPPFDFNSLNRAQRRRLLAKLPWLADKIRDYEESGSEDKQGFSEGGDQLTTNGKPL